MVPSQTVSRLIVTYFDETKKLQDAGTSVVFGGCAAEVEYWDEFIKRWSIALGDSGIRCVKMSAAMAYKDDFYGWRERQTDRDDLLFKLATIIQDAPILKVTCPLLAGDFESLPESQRKKLKDPQYCGFEICVRRVMESYPNDVFQIGCDLTENYAEECIHLFNLIRTKEPDLRKRLIGICFGDDAAYAPLQAADMIAYCARAIAERERFGQEVQPIVQKISKLFESGDVKHGYYVYKAGSQGLGFAEPD